MKLLILSLMVLIVGTIMADDNTNQGILKLQSSLNNATNDTFQCFEDISRI